VAELTANDQIHDATLRRQVYLQQYANGLQQTVIRLLDSTEGDVRAELERRISTLITAEGAAAFTNDTAGQLQAMTDAIAAIRGPAIDQALNGTLSDNLQELGPSESSYMDDTFKTHSPVVLDTALPNALQLAAAVQSSPMEGRVLSDWASGLAADDTQRIMDAVRSGMAEGKTSDSIIRDVLGTGVLNGADGVTETTRRNAAAITQTAVATVASDARAAYSEANSDIIDKEVWVATLDGFTCEECAALDGQQFDVGDGDQPPAHYNCRCVRVPSLDGKLIGDRPYTTATEDALDGMSEDERRQAVEDMTGQVPASMTYQDWLSRQSEEFQNDVLGPARADLFRDGMPLSKFVNRDGDTLTLDELESKGASTLFVSPNIDDGVQFDDAVTRLDSARQAAILDANSSVDEMLGLDAKQANVIGAWADGAENSIATTIAPGTDYETLKAAAAMKGEIANQKAVLLFQEGNPEGTAFLGQFKMDGNLNDIHDTLLKDGLPYHTLEPLPDGGARVYVFGEDQNALTALNSFGEANGKNIEVAFGKGEFVGSQLQSGADAAWRADAVNQYEATIRSYLADKSSAVGEAWDRIYSDWRSAESKLPGLKAFGATDSKEVVGDWISSSPVRSVADLKANAVANDELLRGFGQTIADDTGAEWHPGPIKTDERIQAKIDRGGKLPAQITDVVRGSFYVDNPDQVREVIASLSKEFPLVDENWRVTEAGYFDRTLKLRMPDGTIGEVQIGPPALFEAKQAVGHDLYAEWQTATAANDLVRADDLKNQMITLYSDARAQLSPAWTKLLNNELGGIPEAKAATIDAAVGIKAVGTEASDKVLASWAEASPIKTPDMLFTAARVNDPLLTEVGNSIAADIPGVEYRAPGIKGVPRTMEKIAAGRAPAEVNDVVRGTFSTPTSDDANRVVKELAKKYPIVDEGWRMTPFGYFDRPVKVLFPNGQIGEVLLAPPDLIEAKSNTGGGGHLLYKEARSMAADDPRLPELIQKQRDLYGAAQARLPADWREVLKHAAKETLKENLKDKLKDSLIDKLTDNN
jgi:SPP1 gp7 family putative phage head morphogenesis protein